MFEVRMATPEDNDNIFYMIHEIYANELGQYQQNNYRYIVDRLHKTNNYIVAYDKNKNLVGMVAITKPNTAEISTIKRIKDQSIISNLDIKNLAEIRLLSIKKEVRGSILYFKMINELFNFCSKNGIDKVIISAISNKISLYKTLGFYEISDPILDGKCIYQPMILDRKDFENSKHYKILKHFVMNNGDNNG